jgi:chaperone required for assembly of F1-ATPase
MQAMSDDFSEIFFPGQEPRPDPRAAARASTVRQLPRRFYREAGTQEREGAFVLVLDGRPARTPAKSLLALPTADAADLVAREWEAQREEIDPAAMPVTRLVNAAIDGVAAQAEAVAAEIASYGGSDLLCYRAADPERLVQRQAAVWDPVLDWAHEVLGARFVLAEGVMFQAQPAPALSAVERAVAAFPDPFGLAALSTMTSLTGSVLLALAVAHGRLSTAEAWAAAHLDEDFQMEVWGQDEEALARRARRWSEMQAAAAILAATRPAG